MRELWKKRRVDSILVFLLIGVDLVTKAMALEWFAPIGNRGVALGMFDGVGNILVVIGLGLLLFCVNEIGRIERVLILAGAFGNLADRVMDGQIIDWLLLPGANLWFNVADIYLTMGVSLAMFRELMKWKKK